MDAEIFNHYALVSRIIKDLKDGKASLQIIGRSGDVDMTELFPEYEERVLRDLNVYWLDLRRQIRNQIEADEAEQLIDKATDGIGLKGGAND